MKDIKKYKRRLFFRSFRISFVVFMCLFIGILATAKSYEGIMLTRYGQYKKAFEITDRYIRFFDIELKK